MFNKDLANKKFTEIFQSVGEALRNEDAEGAAKAFQAAQTALMDSIEEQFNQFGNVNDMMVLQQRGLRVLTSEENSWYQEFIGAVKTGAKQAITNLTAAMPITIIDRVIDDMKKKSSAVKRYYDPECSWRAEAGHEWRTDGV